MRDLRNTNPIAKGRVAGLFLEGKPVDSLKLDFRGIVGSSYRGYTRTLGKHDGDLFGRGFVRGQKVPNDRQWSAASVEDLRAISERLGIGEILFGTLRENVVFEGLGHLWHYAPGTVIVFDGQAAFEVSRVNSPCNGVGKRVDALYPGQGVLSQFEEAARPHRGLLGRTYSEGVVLDGSRVWAYSPIAV